MSEAKTLSCAIYTRKSAEEGLSQAFNSLHAQREACEAYIRSQVGEGWVCRPDHYDDGGYSGGAMKRPGLSRLLADITARHVDVVVVYKVDRLTRFLPDFARIIEIFERHDVAFVSVTQAFNTTTSMGRLTLNVLLSFAQFERDVTGERIRDKIAASKAKGMWMGGTLPLGYNAPVDGARALTVNEAEAATVRHIFDRYLETGGLFALQKRLMDDGVRSKRWLSTRDRLIGGYAFSRGALRHLLQNRIYLGEITHKGSTYPGRHPAIVDRKIFEAAQQLLASNSHRRRTHISRADRMLLRGILFDADGYPMAPAFGQSKGRSLAYYASRPLPLEGHEGDDDAIRRAPAPLVESLVRAWAAKLLDMPAEDLTDEAIRRLIGRIELHPSAVQLAICARALPRERSSLGAIRAQLQPGEQVLTDPSRAGWLRLLLPIRLVARGGRTWVTGPSGAPALTLQAPNRKLVRELCRGHAILRQCAIEPGSVVAPRSARAPKSGRDRLLAKMAFLAPDLQAAVLSGQIQTLNLALIPLSWAEQRRLMGGAMEGSGRIVE